MLHGRLGRWLDTIGMIGSLKALPSKASSSPEPQVPWAWVEGRRHIQSAALRIDLVCHLRNNAFNGIHMPTYDDLVTSCGLRYRTFVRALLTISQSCKHYCAEPKSKHTIFIASTAACIVLPRSWTSFIAHAIYRFRRNKWRIRRASAQEQDISSVFKVVNTSRFHSSNNKMEQE